MSLCVLCPLVISFVVTLTSWAPGLRGHVGHFDNTSMTLLKYFLFMTLSTFLLLLDYNWEGNFVLFTPWLTLFNKYSQLLFRFRVYKQNIINLYNMMHYYKIVVVVLIIFEEMFNAKLQNISCFSYNHFNLWRYHYFLIY